LCSVSSENSQGRFFEIEAIILWIAACFFIALSRNIV